MRPDEYCRAKAAPPGSDLHYSLLGLAPAARAAITARYALRHELLGSTDAHSDTDIARHKLDWWRRELDQLNTGRAQHPVSRQLLAYSQQYPLTTDDFTGLIAAAQMDLDYDAYASFDQLLVYAHHAGSSAALQHAQILGYGKPQTAAFAHEAGVALLLLQLLYNVRANALRGRFYIPDDELQRFGVAHNDLAGAHTTSGVTRLGVTELFRFQAERIRAYRQRALDQLAQEDCADQRHLLALLELGSVWLDETEADGFRLLQQHVRLTPLRKLWIAWRTLRREQRRRRGGFKTIESKPV